jgi:tRNA A37 threonylcarbamoyladenosine dehydratase
MNWDRIERLLGEDVLAYLRTQTVGIIGLGSGQLCSGHSCHERRWNFILIDNDIIEESNVLHAADLHYLGKPKVEAVADLIKQRNPDADVKAIVGRIEDHLDIMS